MMPGFTQALAASAILLSVAVRWIRAGASWQAIDDGLATADALRDVTGILDYERLQEVFGPPRLEDGVFLVTRAEARRQRTGLGYLLGDRWLDGASAMVAAVCLLPIWPLWGARPWLDTLLTFATCYQLAGWVAAGVRVSRG